jgi:hypothetical protein
MSLPRRITYGAALAAALALGAGCRPRTDADIQTAQMIVDIGDAVNDLRRDSAALQNQIDSLRLEIARQDTLIRQLANLAGVTR